jgi:hypothetical protein
MRLFLRASFPKLFHLQDLKDPLFKGGQPNWCFENARREYWLQKEAGTRPEFVYGAVSGIPIQSHLGEEWAKGHPINPHAFIRLDGQIVDPTRFRVGNGLVPAKEYWQEVSYQILEVVEESQLLEPMAPESFFK